MTGKAMTGRGGDEHSGVLVELRASRARLEGLERTECELRQTCEALQASERRYRDLYDHAPDMFVSVDAKTTCILDCNETLARALGCRKQQLVGRPVLEIYAPESRDAAGEAFRRFASTGEAHAELKLQRGDGSTLDVGLSASAVRDENGLPLFSRSVLRDISWRKRAEAARQASEDRFRAIVENSCDMISELDRRGHHMWVSPNVTESLGWSADEVLAARPRDLVHPDDFEGCLQGFAEVLETGRMRRHEYRMRHKDGHWVWVETSAAACSREGEPRVLTVTRDVSERRRHLREREAVLREKEEALAQVKVLSGLLPICSHCRKVRDDEGYWRDLETYVSDHSSALFSHSLCEVCLKQHYGHIMGDGNS